MASGDGAAFQAWFEHKVNNLSRNLTGVGKETTQEIKEDMQHFIATRPSEKSGKAGRIESGAMLRSVTQSQSKESKYEKDFEAGYNQTPEYTWYQDQGFDHVNAGHVEGTYAIHDAADIAQMKLPDRVRKALGDA